MGALRHMAAGAAEVIGDGASPGITRPTRAASSSVMNLHRILPTWSLDRRSPLPLGARTYQPPPERPVGQRKSASG